MMDETNISLRGVNRPQWKCDKEVTGALEKQLLYMSFFTEEGSDPSVKEKSKYADLTNLGAESAFAALDSNFHWPGVSTTL